MTATKRDLKKFGKGAIELSKGTVDKYSEDKGFGYIIQDNGRVVLVERDSIDIPGYKTLVSGEHITFELKETIRGPEARKVRKV
jgi:CspA family cold shock protein